MGHYLYRGSYTVEGIKGVLKDGGTARTEVIGQLVESMGGKLESMYWALGEDDVFVTVELPDNVTAAALAARVGASGVASVSTTALMTAADLDAVAAVAVDYRPPGT